MFIVSHVILKDTHDRFDNINKRSHHRRESSSRLLIKMNPVLTILLKKKKKMLIKESIVSHSNKLKTTVSMKVPVIKRISRKNKQ